MAETLFQTKDWFDKRIGIKSESPVDIFGLKKGDRFYPMIGSKRLNNIYKVLGFGVLRKRWDGTNNSEYDRKWVAFATREREGGGEWFGVLPPRVTSIENYRIIKLTPEREALEKLRK